jgi:arylsulfatase A
LGLAENTLVLFFSDNGTGQGLVSKLERSGRIEDFEGGKGDTNEAGSRVPCIARWKGQIPANKINTGLIESCDFLPTICEATGVSLKSMGTIDGRSFLPQLRGQKGQPRDWIYTWYDPRPGHGKERWTKTLRYAFDKRWKLYEDGKLYDWAADPKESNPVENPVARKKLQAVLDRYKREEAAMPRRP